MPSLLPSWCLLVIGVVVLLSSTSLLMSFSLVEPLMLIRAPLHGWVDGQLALSHLHNSSHTCTFNKHAHKFWCSFAYTLHLIISFDTHLYFFSASVRRNKLCYSSTDSEIFPIIKCWFRFATDRDADRKKREPSKRRSRLSLQWLRKDSVTLNNVEIFKKMLKHLHDNISFWFQN